MALETIGETVKDTNFLLFVAWLNRQLAHDFSRPFDAKGGCRFERLEVDDLHRHLAGFISDELVTVSGWLRPLEGDAIRTAPLLRFWATSTGANRVVLRLECIEPALSIYCKKLLERINIQFAGGGEPPTDKKRPVDAEKYPNMARIAPHARDGFLDKWLGRPKAEKESWELMLALIGDGATLFEVSNSRVAISESAISKRLNSTDRLSLGLSLEQIRACLA